MEDIKLEVKRAFVVINSKEYELKFTVGFWKEIKSSCQVNQENLEKKLQEDFAKIATQILLISHKYALPINAVSDLTEESIERELDRSVLDVIEQAYINGMTKQERELAEIFKNKAAKGLKKLNEEDLSIEDLAKKKLQ